MPKGLLVAQSKLPCIIHSFHAQILVDTYGNLDVTETVDISSLRSSLAMRKKGIFPKRSPWTNLHQSKRFRRSIPEPGWFLTGLTLRKLQVLDPKSQKPLFHKILSGADETTILINRRRRYKRSRKPFRQRIQLRYRLAYQARFTLPLGDYLQLDLVRANPGLTVQRATFSIQFPAQIPLQNVRVVRRKGAAQHPSSARKGRTLTLHFRQPLRGHASAGIFLLWPKGLLQQAGLTHVLKHEGRSYSLFWWALWWSLLCFVLIVCRLAWTRTPSQNVHPQGFSDTPETLDLELLKQGTLLHGEPAHTVRGAMLLQMATAGQIRLAPATDGVLSAYTPHENTSQLETRLSLEEKMLLNSLPEYRPDEAPGTYTPPRFSLDAQESFAQRARRGLRERGPFLAGLDHTTTDFFATLGWLGALYFGYRTLFPHDGFLELLVYTLLLGVFVLMVLSPFTRFAKWLLGKHAYTLGAVGILGSLGYAFSTDLPGLPVELLLLLCNLALCLISVFLLSSALYLSSQTRQLYLTPKGRKVYTTLQAQKAALLSQRTKAHTYDALLTELTEGLAAATLFGVRSAYLQTFDILLRPLQLHHAKGASWIQDWSQKQRWAIWDTPPTTLAELNAALESLTQSADPDTDN